MWPLQDKEFVGHKIPQTGPYIEVSQDKAIDELEEIPVERNTKERSPLHTHLRCIQCTEAFLGQINWLTNWDTVPMLPHNFHMRFDGSFSNSWRCEVSQQTGETNPRSGTMPVKLQVIAPLTGPLRNTCDLHYRG